MSKYKIDTILTLVSPMHIGEPGLAYWNHDNRRFQADGLVCARTKHLPVAASAEAADEREGHTPYLPGNSLRGALRRCAGEIMFDIFGKRGEKVGLDLWHVIMCGAASPSPEGSANITETVKAGKHPFVSVFGGGPKMVWSRLSMGNCFPITPLTLGANLVPARFTDLATGNATTAVTTTTTVDDIMRGFRCDPTIIKDAETEIAKWLALLDESRRKKDADEEGKKKSLAGIRCKEIIVPGVKLHGDHRLDTSFAGPSALGLFILALARLANNQRIGGGARDGHGRFILNATACNCVGGSFDLFVCEDGVYSSNLANATVAEAIDAWGKFAAKTKASDLSDGFLLG